MKSRIRSASQPRRRDAGITPYTNEWPAPSAPVDRGPGAVSACRVASRTSARQIASFAASPLRLLLRHPTHRSTETTPSVTSGSDTAYRSQANEKFLASRLLRSQIHRKKPKGKPMPRRTAQANALQIGGPFGGRACLRPAEQAMGLFIRPIGMARAKTKIGFANLVCNMQRMVWPLEQPVVTNPSIRRSTGRSRHPDARFYCNSQTPSSFTPDNMVIGGLQPIAGSSPPLIPLSWPTVIGKLRRSLTLRFLTNSAMWGVVISICRVPNGSICLSGLHGSRSALEHLQRAGSETRFAACYHIVFAS